MEALAQWAACEHSLTYCLPQMAALACCALSLQLVAAQDLLQNRQTMLRTAGHGALTALRSSSFAAHAWQRLEECLAAVARSPARKLERKATMLAQQACAPMWRYAAVRQAPSCDSEHLQAELA